MTPDELIVALRPWIKRHERPCWRPLVIDGNSEATASKFSGTPWLAASESWPKCKRCDRPLTLFLQLNLTELPEELSGRFGKGLLQLFYCRWAPDSCDGHLSWEPFAETCSLVRIIEPIGDRKTEPPLDSFPAKSFRGWECLVDLPDAAAHNQLGIEIDFHRNAVPFVPTSLTCPELGLSVSGMQYVRKLEESVQSRAGDKLAGWPRFVQGVEFPGCPKCGETMQFVMQIDSEDNVPFMFGDCGTGHITQCPTHKDVVAFGWACC